MDEDSATPVSLLFRTRRLPPPPPVVVNPDVDDALLIWAAGETEGFSGRELGKLVTGVRAAVYGSAQRTLDSAIFRAIVEYKARGRGRAGPQRERARNLTSVWLLSAVPPRRPGMLAGSRGGCVRTRVVLSARNVQSCLGDWRDPVAPRAPPPPPP